MSRPNRVQPDGAFLATDARGTFMGNRGILHDADGRLGPKRWQHRAWVCCVTSFKGRKRALMAPNRYTELFFLDEAVALAAGHRPCGECRRAYYARFRALWSAVHGGSGAPKEIDAVLHAARTLWGGRQMRSHQSDAAGLPHGAFFRSGDQMAVALADGQMAGYSPHGYGPVQPRTIGPVTVLTCPPILDMLHAGYAPIMHETLSYTRDTRTS